MKLILIRHKLTGEFGHAWHIGEGERNLIPHEHYEVRMLFDYDNLELYNTMNFKIRFETLEDR